MPSTGMVRIRKLGTTSYCERSVSADGPSPRGVTRPHRGFSVDISTGIPVVIPCSFRSRALTDRANGSDVDSARSTNVRRVGSAFAPAPATASTGSPRRWQAARRSIFVSMLSIASTTKSGAPNASLPRTLSSTSALYIVLSASTLVSGQILTKYFSRQADFGIPTSSLVARQCLLREDSVI